MISSPPYGGGRKIPASCPIPTPQEVAGNKSNGDGAYEIVVRESQRSWKPVVQNWKRGLDRDFESFGFYNSRAQSPSRQNSRVGRQQVKGSESNKRKQNALTATLEIENFNR